MRLIKTTLILWITALVLTVLSEAFAIPSFSLAMQSISHFYFFTFSISAASFGLDRKAAFVISTLSIGFLTIYMTGSLLSIVHFSFSLLIGVFTGYLAKLLGFASDRSRHYERPAGDEWSPPPLPEIEQEAARQPVQNDDLPRRRRLNL